MSKEPGGRSAWRVEGLAVPEQAERAATSASEEWLPAPSVHRTWVYERAFPRKRVCELDGKRPRRPGEAMEQRRREFEAVMAREGIGRAELARRLGCSRAWVTRVPGPHRHLACQKLPSAGNVPGAAGRGRSD